MTPEQLQKIQEDAMNRIREMLLRQRKLEEEQSKQPAVIT